MQQSAFRYVKLVIARTVDLFRVNGFRMKYSMHIFGSSQTFVVADSPNLHHSSTTGHLGVDNKNINHQQQAYGLTSLTGLVIASMVGAGVFTTSGFTLGVVGSPSRVMLCWCLGGAIAMCGAVAYGRLAVLMPESGGEYLYLSRQIHPIAGFLGGWVSLTAGFSGAIATAAVAFERYAMPDGVRPDFFPPDTIAIVLVIICGTAHGINTTAGKLLQNAVVVAKLLALLAFSLTVLSKLNSHTWHLEATSPPTSNLWDATHAIATSLVWISMSYAGFNAAIYVASESTAARQNVPKALLAGTLAVTGLYLILNMAFVTSAPADQLMWKEPVAAIAAKAIGGPWLEFTMRGAVSLGLLSSVLGMMMAGPRVYSKMADDNVFPAVFASSRGGISRSITLQTIIAVSLILAQRIFISTGLLESSLLGLLFYLGTTLSISSALCVATLFLPSVRSATAAKSSVIVDFAAAVYVLATLLAVVLMVLSPDPSGQSQWAQHLSGTAITLLTGLAAWWWFRPRLAD